MNDAYVQGPSIHAPAISATALKQTSYLQQKHADTWAAILLPLSWDSRGDSHSVCVVQN